MWDLLVIVGPTAGILAGHMLGRWLDNRAMNRLAVYAFTRAPMSTTMPTVAVLHAGELVTRREDR